MVFGGFWWFWWFIWWFLVVFGVLFGGFWWFIWWFLAVYLVVFGASRDDLLKESKDSLSKWPFRVECSNSLKPRTECLVAAS